MAAIIELKNITKTFIQDKKTFNAVENASVSIEKGDIFGIIGFSGAGKSTLVRTINLLGRPTSGSVIVKGKNFLSLSQKELREERKKIGMIFQHFNLLMQKSVLDNVCFPLYIQKKSRKEAKKRAKELLEMVGLKDKLKAYPAQLSGGQKQRVAIARALAGNPKILLCDEATSALDPGTTSSILELLRDINEKFGITIVIITHQMSVVRDICSHVAIMKNGRIVETGRVSKVFAHPKSDMGKELLRLDTGYELDEKIAIGGGKQCGRLKLIQ